MKEYWTETTDEGIALNKIISNSDTEENFTRDNEADLKVLNKYLEFEKDDVVLDYGCGVGRLMKPIKEKVRKVIGVDISPKHVEMGKCYAPDCEFVLIDDKGSYAISELPNKVYSVLCFQHIEKCEQFGILCAFNRILKKDGKVLIQFTSLVDQEVNLFKFYQLTELNGAVKSLDYPLMRFSTKEELRFIFKVAGFKNIKVFTEERKDRLWVRAEK